MSCFNNFQIFIIDNEHCIMDDNLISTNKKHQYGHRRFYEIPNICEVVTQANEIRNGMLISKECRKEEKCKLLKFIYEDVIGKESCFIGSYGKRKVVYCDYIASGRALGSIEKYLVDNVLPIYGNTHTTTTVTSLQSSMFMNESR